MLRGRPALSRHSRNNERIFAREQPDAQRMANAARAMDRHYIRHFEVADAEKSEKGCRCPRFEPWEGELKLSMRARGKSSGPTRRSLEDGLLAVRRVRVTGVPRDLGATAEGRLLISAHNCICESTEELGLSKRRQPISDVQFQADVTASGINKAPSKHRTIPERKRPQDYDHIVNAN